MTTAFAARGPDRRGSTATTGRWPQSGRAAAAVPCQSAGKACQRVTLAWADAGYAGKVTVRVQATFQLGVAIVRRREVHTVQVLPRHWGRRAHLRLDQEAPPHRPRLRTPALNPRSHGHLGQFNPVSGGYGELQNQNPGLDIVVQDASTASRLCLSLGTKLDISNKMISNVSGYIVRVSPKLHQIIC